MPTLSPGQAALGRVNLIWSGASKIADNPATRADFKARALAIRQGLGTMLQSFQHVATAMATGTTGSNALYLAQAAPVFQSKIENLENDLVKLRADMTVAGTAKTMGWKRGSNAGMGIWSLDPNEWGMTQDQATAYELQKAQQKVQLAQLQAQASAANPGVLSTIAGAVKTTTAATASTYNILLFLGVGLAAVWGWNKIHEHAN